MIQLLMCAIMATLVSGCATVVTRTSLFGSEPKGLYPATKADVTGTIVYCRNRLDPVGFGRGAGGPHRPNVLEKTLWVVFATVDLPISLVTDTLCFPWDLADKKRRNKGSSKASDFPTVAQRTTFFEPRINSKDSEIRKRVLTEVGYFYSLPDQEYRSFLKQLYWDDDPCVRGMAIKKLYDMWVPQDPSVLPKVFTGYHCGQLIDTTSATCTADLISQCSQNNLAAGYAAYVLGLLRAEEAIPSLTNLLNHSNIFVRYTAARALFDCGDQAIAVATFDDITSQQLILYESLGKTSDCPVSSRISPEPWYAACACRALIAAGGGAKRRGVARLIQLMGCLQRSTDVNDQSNLHWVRGILAEISNQYFVSAEDAAGWFKQQQETKAAIKPLENTDTATSDPQR